MFDKLKKSLSKVVESISKKFEKKEEIAEAEAQVRAAQARYHQLVREMRRIEGLAEKNFTKQ